MANDFTGDTNCVALWSLDNGALTTDSIGGNTLTDNNTVGTDTVNYKEGDASADFEFDNDEYLSITNANLDSGFPIKSGGTGTFSLTFWYKAESQSNYAALVSKYDNNAQRSFFIRDNNGTLEFYIGYNSGGSAELLDDSHSLSTGVWYHIGATFKNSDKSWQLRVYEEGSGTTTYSGTATNNIFLSGAPFAIGAWFSSGSPTPYYLDGLVDEVVVFDDILSIGEIDQIRQGTYIGGAYSLALDAGSFTLTGADIAFLRTYLIPMSAGSFTLTGADANFLYSRIFNLDGGSFTLSGEAANFLFGYIASLESGSFTLTGADINFLYGYNLSASGGSFVLTGSALDFFRNYIFEMTGGTYVLTGNICNLRYSVLRGDIHVSFSSSQPTVTFS